MSDPWSQEQDEQLRALVSSGMSMAAIEAQMKRTKLKVAIARDRNPIQESPDKAFA
jgi:hypothetical protein